MSKNENQQTLLEHETAHGYGPDPKAIHKALSKRSFASIASTSPAGWSHVAGVIYEFVDGDLYINTLRTSRKARNIAVNPRVGVLVLVRRLPVGPPSNIQFQGKADLLEIDDPAITDLLHRGKLKSMTSHGELELEDSCFIRVSFGPKVSTYGLGMSLPTLIKDPLSASGSARLVASQ